jgi:hypothetical protein
MTATVSASARPGTAVHLSGYQARDFEVVDYQMTKLPGTGLSFRGPLPTTLDQPGGYFACIGAAQTLGCFCDHPFPDLVSQAIGMPVLNLGYGGAGPEFYLGQTALLPYLNRAKFVIMQVMSARSQSNSLYSCGGLEFVTLRKDGRQMGAHGAIDEMLKGPRLLQGLPLPWRMRRKLGNILARPRAKALVAEMRANWLESSLALLGRIEVPVLLCWISKRQPDYQQMYGTGTILGEFPHLIDSRLLDPLKSLVLDYAEATTSRGSPQPLVSRFTGAPVTVSPSDDREDLGAERWTSNFYYPSPEMHEDTARELLAVLARHPALTA